MCDAVRCSVWYEAAMFLEDAAKAAQAKVSPQSRLHPGLEEEEEEGVGIVLVCACV